MENEKKDIESDVIFGRNSILEALRADRAIDCLMVAAGDRIGAVQSIIAQCREKGITIKEVNPQKLEYMAAGVNHQGVAAVCAAYEYVEVDDIINAAKEKGEPPFIIICDEIEDPHNMGAIIRTAEASGAHGVIIPKRRSATLTSAVAKSSSGALEYIKVAKVANLASTIDDLKEQGIWIYGADMDGQNFKQVDFSGAVALVIGSEEKGMNRLVREKCDFVVSLPMKGKVNSLNAAVAAGIIMYEISTKRG